MILFCISQVVFCQEWHKDYQVALGLAKEAGKPVLVVFSGSDWCAPCLRLEQEIWGSDAFEKYANEKAEIYKADFPRKKKNQLPQSVQDQNRILAEKFNTKKRFPLVVLLDYEEQVLGSIGYRKLSPEKYIAKLNSFVK